MYSEEKLLLLSVSQKEAEETTKEKKRITENRENRREIKNYYSDTFNETKLLLSSKKRLL